MIKYSVILTVLFLFFCLSAEDKPAVSFHLTEDISFTYGIGIYSALGFQSHTSGQLSVWETKHAAGSLDAGIILGFQGEPQALQYLATDGIETETYRLNSWAAVGTSFHMGKKRNYTLGVHFFGGWTHLWTKAAADRDDLDFNSSVSDNYGHYNFGGILKFDWRFYKYLGISIHAAGPFPVGPSYITTLFHVGLGLTVYPF